MVKVVLMTLTVVGTLLSAFPAQAQSLSAHVDRNVVSLDETFRLILEAQGQDQGAEPDLSPLTRDFDTLGTSKSTRVNMINDRVDTSTQWVVTLAPRKPGEYRVPPIQVGSARSSPVTIKVVQRPQSDSGDQTPDLFLEAEAEPKDPYVQGQVTYTVRLYDGVGIREGGLSEPQPQGAMVERLGDDLQFETRKHGRRYRVTERRYAIFPERSGLLTIPAPVFSGRVADTRRQPRSRFDELFGGGRSSLFGPDPFDTLLQATRPVRVHGPELALEARPRPATAAGASWLPAESLTLKEAWSPDPPTFRVGEPVTRTVTMLARGLTGSQLPELPQPSSAAFKRYPDQPSAETHTQGIHVVGKRVQKLALVPMQAGHYTLPELRVRWWDTAADEPRIATLPARTVTVLPAPAGAQPTQTPTVQRPALPAPAPAAPNSEDRAPSRVAAPAASGGSIPWVWPWLSGILLVVWLVTLGLWLRDRRRDTEVSRRPATAPSNAMQSERAARRELERACRENRPGPARDALLAWAAAHWPRHAPQTLVALAKRLDVPEAQAAVAALDRVLYSPGAESWDGQTFWRQFSGVMTKTRQNRDTPRREPLPALYPQR